MTGPRALYDLSAPEPEPEEEQPLSLGDAGSWREPLATLADVPPLPPSPPAAAPQGRRPTTAAARRTAALPGRPSVLEGFAKGAVEGTAGLVGSAGDALAAYDVAPDWQEKVASTSKAMLDYAGETFPGVKDNDVGKRFATLATQVAPYVALGAAGPVAATGAILLGMGQGVGSLYRALVDQGVPEERARSWAQGAGPVAGAVGAAPIIKPFMPAITGALVPQAAKEAVAKSVNFAGGTLGSQAINLTAQEGAAPGSVKASDVSDYVRETGIDAALFPFIPHPPLPRPRDRRVSPPQDAPVQNMRPPPPSETMFKRSEADPSLPGTYSALRKAIEDAPIEEGTAKQWAPYLNSKINKGEVKAKEVDATGLLPKLESAADMPRSKEAILDHLDSHSVKLEAIERSEEYSDDPDKSTRWHYNQQAEDEGSTVTTPAGGEPGTYTETLITAPEMTKGGQPYKETHFPGVDNVIAHTRADERVDRAGNRYYTVQELQATIHQEAQKKRIEEIDRIAEEEDIEKSEAAKRVPRDFGYETAAKKQAREEAAAAYKAAVDAYARAVDAKDVDDLYSELTDEDKSARYKEQIERIGALSEAKQEAAARMRALEPAGAKPVPDAPFKDWIPLTLKHALASAVKKGLTRLAWTTGDMQNERNSLSTKVRELRYHVAPDGKYEIEAFPIDRTPVTMTVKPRDLAGAVGKDIAGRIQAQEGEVVVDKRGWVPDHMKTEKRALKGDNLEMGGDGKRAIYDVMVKNELERLGKRWGVKAKSVELPHERPGGRAGPDDDDTPGEGPRYEVKLNGPDFVIHDYDKGGKIVEKFPTREEAEAAIRTKYTAHVPYHYIDIPPEMAASIREDGLPLYQRSGKEAAPGTGVKLTHDLEGIYERSPEYVEKRQQVEDAAKDVLKKLAPGLDLKVADRLIAEIDGKREEVAGAYYTPALDGNLIDHMVAISMRSPDWEASLNHEVIHFLHRAGYINDAEWSVLQRRAERGGLDKREMARMTDLRSRELNATEAKELAGLENKATWIQRFDIEKLYPNRQDIWAEEAVAKAKEAFLRGELQPGTFIAKVFDKIAQFFDALGLRLESLGLTTAEQVFRRVDSGEVGARNQGTAKASETVQQRTSKPLAKTDAHRLSNIDILHGDEVEERAPGSRTKSQVGFELNERAKKLLAELKIPAGDYSDPKLMAIMSDAIAAEIVAAYKASGSASGWYSSTLVDAMKIATTMHPELQDDPAARVPFLLAMAIGSQNMDVKANLKLAERAYSAYKKDGKFPLLGQGTASKSMAGNFAKANALMAEYPPDQVEKFLNTKFKVAELERAGWDIGGEKADQDVYGSAIFGPKIGNGFYQNLTGNFDPLTMDMWFMRGMGRLSGDLMPGDPELVAKQRTRLLNALKTEKVAADGRKIDWYALTPRAEQAEELGIEAFSPASIKGNDDILMEFAHRIVGWHTSDYMKNRAGYDSGKLVKPEVVQAAKRLLEQGATNDQPGSGGRRVELRTIFRNAMETARQDIPGLTTADAQAIWWYPEKELYKRLGYRAKRAEPTDYALEMAALAREKGIGDDEIERARRGSDGRGGADAGTAAGEGESARPAYEKGERQEFLTTRVLGEIEARRGPGALVYERRVGDDTRSRPVVAGRAVTPVSQFNVPRTTANALRAIGVTAPDIFELPATSAAPEFHAAISAAKAGHSRGSAVYAYSPEEYGKMRLFTTADGKAGFALKGDDIVSVFNADPAGLKGWALTALMLATQQGGRRLDAFDIGLPRAYSLAGFRAVARISWSDPDQPAGWDKNAFARFNNGEPDVVFMRYDPAYGNLYEPGDGEKFTGPDAYERAAKKQEKP